MTASTDAIRTVASTGNLLDNTRRGRRISARYALDTIFNILVVFISGFNSGKVVLKRF